MNWRPIKTAPRDGTPILWAAQTPAGWAYSVIHYPTYRECFEHAGSFWALLFPPTNEAKWQK